MERPKHPVDTIGLHFDEVYVNLAFQMMETMNQNSLAATEEGDDDDDDSDDKSSE